MTLIATAEYVNWPILLTTAPDFNDDHMTFTLWHHYIT